jgi:hypothetical protein
MSEATYKEGYESGKNWKYDHVPGGPFVPSGTRTYQGHPKYAERKRIEDQSKIDHADWMQGWRDGFAVKGE